MGAFTWFTTLPANSIQNWRQLETLFHEHFYRGEIKVNVVDLTKIQIKDKESINDYISRFRLMKVRCMTKIPDYELIQMVITGLNYDVRKRMFNLNEHVSICRKFSSD
jgi:hypothetical protein